MTVIHEAVKTSRRNALSDPDRTGYVPSISSGVCRNVCEDSSVNAIAALQQILAEQPGRADAEAQAGGDGSVVARRLARPGVQRTKREENGRGEADRSNRGNRQTCLQKGSVPARLP
ncbi:hypothetical protein SAMN05428945_6455 [Streptomyces sp. 2224.1]|nr:hypothetical protein SAMN05428945_6455 [Streptomyces sp. 2224.1]